MIYIFMVELCKFCVNSIASGYNDIWIGLTLSTDVQFEWMSGESLSFQNFADLDSGTDCVVLRSSDNYAWNDTTCTDSFAYICETAGMYMDARARDEIPIINS